MRLNEAKIGAKLPVLPPELSKHIRIITTCELLPAELEAMLKVTELMQTLYSNLQREQLYNISALPEKL